MKVLLSLISLCITLSLCHGSCFKLENKIELIGKLVAQDVCTDVFNGTKHPIGTLWRSTGCLHCICRKSGMECFVRHGNIKKMKGCFPVIDAATCEYKYYSVNNPTLLCP